MVSGLCPHMKTDNEVGTFFLRGKSLNLFYCSESTLMYVVGYSQLNAACITDKKTSFSAKRNRSL